MVTRLEFRGAIPCRTSSDRVLSIVRKYPNDIPSIKSAFSALVLSKRPVAAKRLFQDSLPYLDSPTKVWLGCEETSTGEELSDDEFRVHWRPYHIQYSSERHASLEERLVLQNSDAL
ncbi:long-chain fatty acid-- ligase [Lentinula edodes]|uniref:Long-chain fatty acid--ligase n=1 Tax=Lentinula edodes TaxID=5353 RepID=A0A1Q3EPG7_LENED|nr:long-chain fatty acid-- ligase [Lentinula edodes]